MSVASLPTPEVVDMEYGEQEIKADSRQKNIWSADPASARDLGSYQLVDK